MFPFLAAREARRRGHRVVAVAFPEETDPSLAREVDEIHWARVGQLGKILTTFRRAGVRQAVMCGQVRHTHVFQARPDWRAVKLAIRLPDTRTDTILGAFAKELERDGIHLEDSTLFLRDHLATEGAQGRRKPDRTIHKDLAFGWQIAKRVAELDIGQTVVVKKGSVVAVESVEGTDEAIRRGARYAGPGVSVIKVAKPKQDMRFDVPVVGERTISVLREVKAAALAIEAGRTLFLDRSIVVRAADAAGVALWGMRA